MDVEKTSRPRAQKTSDIPTPTRPLALARRTTPTLNSHTPPHTPTSDTSELAPMVLRLAHLLAFPTLLFIAVSTLQLALVTAMSPPGSPGIWHLLLGWDAQHYLYIAEHGYPNAYTVGELDQFGQPAGSNLVFFPLFPALIRTIHVLTGLTYGDAALTAARLTGIAAVTAVFHLFTGLYNRRVGALMAGLVLAQPLAIALTMAYTEALFLALAAAALLAAHRQAWLTAGLCGLLAGLTRSTGLAVGLAVAVAAGMALHQQRRWTWRPVTASVLALAGTPAYLLWVGARVGRLDAWFAMQDTGWGTRLDFGASTWRFLTTTLLTGTDWVSVSIALIVVATAVCCALALNLRPWPPLAVYGLLILAAALGQSNYFCSKPRMLVPALIVLLPAALALAKTRDRTTLLAMSGALVIGAWYGAYMLTVWISTI